MWEKIIECVSRHELTINFLKFFAAEDVYATCAVYILIIPILIILSWQCWQCWSNPLTGLDYILMALLTVLTYLATGMMAGYILIAGTATLGVFFTYGLNFGNWLWLQQCGALVALYYLGLLGAKSHNAHIELKESLQDGSQD